MDEKRKGEIAYAIIRQRTMREGICVNPEQFRRELGNASQALGIDSRELMEFQEALARDLVEAVFQKS